MQVVLIRPGLTEYDREDRVQGTLDVPLCSEGRQEVAHISDELREFDLDVLYVAPEQAAKETARALGEATDTRLKTLPKLRNLDCGLWQGMLVEDVRLKQPKVYKKWLEKPETVCPPQGETIAAARERVEQVLSKLKKRHRGETIGIVVAEPLNSVVRQMLQDCQLGDLWDVDSEQQWMQIGVDEDMIKSPAT